jgi:hypothetical protein
MKMNLFILMGIAVLILFVKIVTILVIDLDNLTKYGFGYLTGLIITFLILLGTTVFIGFQVFREKRVNK